MESCKQNRRVDSGLMRKAGVLASVGAGVVMAGGAALGQPQHYVIDDLERVTQIEHVEKTSDGGYILTGTMSDLTPNRLPGPSDVWIAKYTADDVLQWQRRIGLANIEDQGLHVQELLGGGYVIAFRTISSNRLLDAGLLRLSATGGFVWSRTYVGTHESFDPRHFTVRQFGNNLVLVNSWRPVAAQPPVAVTQLINPANGAPVSQQQWLGGGGVRIEAFTDSRVLPGNQLLICGDAVLPQSPQFPQHDRAVVMRFDPASGVAWMRTYGPAPLSFASFAFTSARGLMLASNGVDFVLNGDVSVEVPAVDAPRGGNPLPTEFVDGLYVMRGAIGNGNQAWFSVLEDAFSASAAVLPLGNRIFVAGTRPFGDGDANGIVYGFDFGTGVATDKNGYFPATPQLSFNNSFNTLASVSRGDARVWLPAGRIFRFFGTDGGYLARADVNGFADCFVADPVLNDRRLNPGQIGLQPDSQACQGNGNWTNVLVDPAVPQLAIVCAAEPCGPADVGSEGGAEGPDGVLDNNDFIVFIGWFFANDPRADIGSTGGAAGGDNAWDNNDFIVFINFFFEGC